MLVGDTAVMGFFGPYGIIFVCVDILLCSLPLFLTENIPVLQFSDILCENRSLVESPFLALRSNSSFVTIDS